MLLYHASFQGAVQNIIGTNSKVTPFDGFVILQTDSNDLSALVDLTSNPIQNPFNPDVLPGLNNWTVPSFRAELTIDCGQRRCLRAVEPTLRLDAG